MLLRTLDEHTNRETLALLNVETLARNTHNCIGVGLHSKKADNFVDVLELLSAADVCRLTKDGTEIEGLSHRGSMKMKVLLLHIARFALEGLISQFSVNQHFASHNTHGHSSSEHIQ